MERFLNANYLSQHVTRRKVVSTMARMGVAGSVLGFVADKRGIFQKPDMLSAAKALALAATTVKQENKIDTYDSEIVHFSQEEVRKVEESTFIIVISGTIKDDNNVYTHIGTGWVAKPEKNSAYAYIVTAGHMFSAKRPSDDKPIPFSKIKSIFYINPSKAGFETSDSLLSGVKYAVSQTSDLAVIRSSQINSPTLTPMLPDLPDSMRKKYTPTAPLDYLALDTQALLIDQPVLMVGYSQEFRNQDNLNASNIQVEEGFIGDPKRIVDPKELREFLQTSNSCFSIYGLLTDSGASGSPLVIKDQNGKLGVIGIENSHYDNVNILESESLLQRQSVSLGVSLQDLKSLIQKVDQE